MNSNRPICSMSGTSGSSAALLPRMPVTVLAMTTATIPAPSTTPTMSASGRWATNGSVSRSSDRSTPSSMITNRNSTTMAPA